MSTKKQNKYTPEFKQTIVNLYHSGKNYAQIKSEYGVSSNALTNWIRQYSEVKLDDNTVVTAQQIKELQKRNAQLEEENLILKKPLQYSCHTQATIDRCTGFISSAFYFDPLPSFESESQYILQISEP